MCLYPQTHASLSRWATKPWLAKLFLLNCPNCGHFLPAFCVALYCDYLVRIEILFFLRSDIISGKALPKHPGIEDILRHSFLAEGPDFPCNSAQARQRIFQEHKDNEARQHGN